MRAIVIVVVVLITTAPVFGAACTITGQSTVLKSAAAALAAGEWCELTPAQLNFTLNANEMKDVVGSCGDDNLLTTYAHNMAYDPSQGTDGIIFWAGTGHGTSYRAFYYDIGTNTWELGPTTTGLCSSETTCTFSDWEGGSVVQCGSCNAEHSYDSMTDDNNGNFYRVDYGGLVLHKITLAGGWDKNWETSCNAAAYNTTSAMDFWPDFGASGTLVESCSGNACNSALWLYDMNTGVWTDPFADTWSGCFYNNTINYNHGSKEVWVTAGSGATNHHRLWNNSGVPTLTALSAAPSGRVGLDSSKCIDDPIDPSGKFVCWDMSEDTVGTSSNGWYEFDMGEDLWISFTAMGITSMPPLKAIGGGTPVVVASVPEYGVSVWVGHDDDEGTNNGGMFVYRHTDSEISVSPPAPPSEPPPYPH